VGWADTCAHPTCRQHATPRQVMETASARSAGCARVRSPAPPPSLPRVSRTAPPPPPTSEVARGRLARQRASDGAQRATPAAVACTYHKQTRKRTARPAWCPGGEIGGRTRARCPNRLNDTAFQPLGSPSGHARGPGRVRCVVTKIARDRVERPAVAFTADKLGKATRSRGRWHPEAARSFLRPLGHAEGANRAVRCATDPNRAPVTFSIFADAQIASGGPHGSFASRGRCRGSWRVRRPCASAGIHRDVVAASGAGDFGRRRDL
jgi:hypothetical protein